MTNYLAQKQNLTTIFMVVYGFRAGLPCFMEALILQVVLNPNVFVQVSTEVKRY